MPLHCRIKSRMYAHTHAMPPLLPTAPCLCSVVGGRRAAALTPSTSLTVRRSALDYASPRSAINECPRQPAVASCTACGRSEDGCSSSSTATTVPAAKERCSLDCLYTSVNIMHRGRTATLQRARESRSNAPVVIKSFVKARLTASKREAVAREARLLRAAAGPGVVRLLAEMETEDALCIVLEACSGARVARGWLYLCACVHALWAHAAVCWQCWAVHAACAGGGCRTAGGAWRGQQHPWLARST